jgi:hypothetical protein
MSDTIAELRLPTEELREGIAFRCGPIRGIAVRGPIKPELDRE